MRKTFAIGSEKKVPMPLRILFLLIEWAIFFGFGGFRKKKEN